MELMKEALTEKEKQVRLLESEIEKMGLLYKEKVEFLEKQIEEGDEQRLKEFVIEKNKYKARIRELTDEI